MRYIELDVAQKRLAELAQAAAQGESIILVDDGKPLAQIIAVSAPPATGKKRQLGFMRGQWNVPDDFDEIDRDEIAKLFSGEK